MTLRNFFSFIIFLVGAVALVLPRGYALGFFLACLSGLLLWLPKQESLIDSKNKWLVLPCVVYAIGHIVIGLSHQWTWRTLDPYVPFVLFVFCVWAIRKYRPSTLFFWAGLAVGAMGAACLAGYQALVLGLRSGGFNHPIQFGNVALLMGVLCLVRLLTVRSSRWMDFLMLVGVASGLAASVWSQTRGGWLAMLLIMGWMLHKATQNWGVAKRALIAGAMLAALAIPALQPNGIVQNRVMAAITEFEGYLESRTQDSSVGARLAMWEFAYKDLAVAPLIGRGAEGWKQSRDAGIKSGSLDPFLRDFSHLHNEFFDVLYKNGLIGLSLLLTL